MSQSPVNDAESFLFYCDMSALSAAERTAHQQLIGQVFGPLLEETRELPDGYAYRFAVEQYPQVAAFIANERRCCPFLRFTLSMEPHGGPVWLHLTAPGDVKPFLREELGHYVPSR